MMLTACAYNVGMQTRALPQGYRAIEVPVFTNLTLETGAETSFTNAIIAELSRLPSVSVQEPGAGEVKLFGQIKSISVLPSSEQSSAQNPLVPFGATIATGYTVAIKLEVRLLRRTDNTLIWSTEVVQARSYTSAQMLATGLNTLNPLYNQSAKTRAVTLLAQDMASLVVDQMTETF